MMTEEQYMIERVNPQIEWHDKKGTCNKCRYYIFSWIIIICSVFTGVIIQFCEIAGEILSIVVAITASISNFCKFQDKWRLYRLTTELLVHEKYIYETQSDKYAGEDSFKLFVESIEDILMKTNKGWEKLLEGISQVNGTTDRK